MFEAQKVVPRRPYKSSRNHRHTLGLVPSVEDMTNWGGDYLNGQAVVGASCSDNGAIDDLERLFFRPARSSLVKFHELAAARLTDSPFDRNPLLEGDTLL